MARELAVRGQTQEARALAVPGQSHSVAELWEMATYVAESGMFPGLDKPASVFSLMLVCQGEKLHPSEALKRYHMIHGRPSLKAEWILAKFQSRGGRVVWHHAADDGCDATFTSKYHPEPFRVTLTLAECQAKDWDKEWDRQKGAFATKGTWKKTPGAMMRARAVTIAVRATDPGTLAGFSDPDELTDIVSTEAARQAEALPPPSPAPAALAKPVVTPEPQGPEIPVPGWPDPQRDPRPYRDVAKGCVEAINRAVRELCEDESPTLLEPAALHRATAQRAAEAGLIAGGFNTVREAIARLTEAYNGPHRDQIRGLMAEACIALQAEAVDPIPETLPGKGDAYEGPES